MRVRTIRGCPFVLALALCLRSVQAQGPSPDSNPGSETSRQEDNKLIEEIQKTKDELKKEIDAIRQSLDKRDETLLQAVAEKIAKVKVEVSKDTITRKEFDDTIRKLGSDLTGQGGSLNRRIDALSDQLSRTSDKMDALSRRVDGISDRLNRVLTRDSQGNDMLAVRSQMQLDEFRKDFGDAVRGVVPPIWGKLKIYNYTGADQHLIVNGTRWHVRAFPQVTEIRVPVGKVLTELWPYEAPKTRTVGPENNYEAKVELTLRQPAVSPPLVIIEEPPVIRLTP